MPRKTLYIVSGIAEIFFALNLIFMPVTFWELHGVEVGLLGIWIGRIMTSMMIANLLLRWRFRNEPRESFAARIFSQGQVIAWGLVSLFTTLTAFAAGLNAMIWGTVAIGIAFVILFALDGFKN
jgi:hypothetical protein